MLVFVPAGDKTGPGEFGRRRHAGLRRGTGINAGNISPKARPQSQEVSSVRDLCNGPLHKCPQSAEPMLSAGR